MVTRSRIGILNEDQSITSIYCHWDGYPDGVGATLKEHYSSTPRALRLQSMGDMSSLMPTIEESTFYGRDRNEDGVEAQRSISKTAFLSLAEKSGAYWAYLWNGQEWKRFLI